MDKSCFSPSRRQLLRQTAAGFGSLALAALLQDSAYQDIAYAAPAAGNTAIGDAAAAKLLAQNPLSERAPHFPAKAKRVIFLFMHGGPSHVDTFDYKPLLKRDHGKPIPFAKPRVQFAKTGNLMQSPWAFKQHGQSGLWISDLFPHLSKE